MPEWLQNLLTAIGGGSVVLVGVLTVFKKLFLKLFETGIESSFEKSLEKYRNTLSRTTKAYEILLDREMRFYEKIEPIIANIILTEHDLRYCSEYDDEIDKETARKNYADCLCKYGDVLKALKNETLLHQSYLPASVFMSVTVAIGQMQSDLQFWVTVGQHFFKEEYDAISNEEKESVEDNLFKQIAALQVAIKQRLAELSGLDTSV